MNRFENILKKFNFKKIFIWYIITALIAGLICAGTVCYFFRERLNFAFRYSRIEEAESAEKLESAVSKTAAASADVIDVIVTDENGKVLFSAKKSSFSNGTLKFAKTDREKDYLVSETHPNAVFRYVKSEEFMLNSIINKDFGKIRSDYDEESVFEENINAKTIYMLNRINMRKLGSSVYVITVPTSVPGGETVLKLSAATAVLFFCVYWVLVALWMYKDALKCKLPPLYWGLIGLFTNVVGLVIYKIYKRGMSVCISCGAAQSSDCLYCSYCGTQLGMRCEKCGSKITPRNNYCSNCGNKIK